MNNILKCNKINDDSQKNFKHYYKKKKYLKKSEINCGQKLLEKK